MRSICLFSRLLNSAQGLLFCAQSVALSTSLRRNTGLRSGGIALVLDLVIVLAVQGLFLCLKVLGCQQPPGRLEPSRSAFAAQRPLTHTQALQKRGRSALLMAADWFDLRVPIKHLADFSHCPAHWSDFYRAATGNTGHDLI